MSTATPAINTPPDEPGWRRLLRNILSECLNATEATVSWLFEILWPLIAAGWKKAEHFVIKHRRCILLLIVAVLFAQPLTKVMCDILGFASSGIRAGSIAARIQSIFYGGFIPAGSPFSILQSFGAL